jgi:hypothetical protein
VDAKLRQRLTRALSIVDEHGTYGPRLIDQSSRLWRRVGALSTMGLVADPIDAPALELASWALQLPMRSTKLLPAGKLGRTNLRERAEQSAELLVSVLAAEADESLMDRTTALLLAVPQRNPVSDDAKLLADAVNLDDFGVSGFVQRVIQLGRQGDGVTQVVEANDKREQYGYWEARLKDGFHFEPVRKLARKRLENARAVAKLLADELSGEVP